MYKITLYDESCSPICDGVISVFVDDLEAFEKYWLKFAEEQTKDRYFRSKAGELVTDYYGNNEELNIVQQCKDCKMFWEKEFELQNQMFELSNAYGCSSCIYAENAKIILKCVEFNENVHLIGKYRLEGVCRKDFFSKQWIKCDWWGNPFFIDGTFEKEMWIDEEGNRRRDYKKEVFCNDYLETYCWLDIVSWSIEDERKPIKKLTESIIAALMRDIPGEAG